MDYKVTQVGKIPAHWNVEKIDNLKSKKKHAIAMGPFGSRIKKENFIEVGVPIIRGNNLKRFNFDESEFVYVSEEKAEELKSSIVKKGDLVITHRGTLGQVGIIPENSKFEKYVVSQSGMKLTCDPSKINSDFLYYYLNSRIGQYHLLMNKSQVGVPAIAQASTSLKKIPVPLPPLNEQLAIVKVLNMINEKINIVAEEIQILEEISKTLFKHWFINFEFPNEEKQPYKSSGGEMVESELGGIPSNWRIGSIDEVGSVVGGGTPSKKHDEYYTSSGISWITPKDLSSNKSIYIYKGATDITELGLKKGSAKLLPKNTVLFSSRAPIGYIAIAGQKVTTNQGFKSIVPDKGFNSYYIYHLLHQKLPNIEAAAGGSTFKEISGKGLKEIPIIVPPITITEEFEEIVSPLFLQIQSLEKENQQLKELRDTLLPKLLLGEIEIPSEVVVD